MPMPLSRAETFQSFPFLSVDIRTRGGSSTTELDGIREQILKWLAKLLRIGHDHGQSVAYNQGAALFNPEWKALQNSFEQRLAAGWHKGFALRSDPGIIEQV